MFLRMTWLAESVATAFRWSVSVAKLLRRICPSAQLSLAAILAFGGGFQASLTTAKMTHIVARMSGTDIDPDSFAAKPKVYWRAGNRYCRIDEEPDPKNNIQGRTIINEPDAWLINLANGTAKHSVDQGPTFNCRLPIFAFDQEMVKSEIGRLEFGQELQFFRRNGAKLVKGPKLDFPTNFYELTIGDTALRLVERADIHVPILVGLVRGNSVIEVHYFLWEETPFRNDLFAPPADVEIEQVK